jgi:hypothetical protein
MPHLTTNPVSHQSSAVTVRAHPQIPMGWGAGINRHTCLLIDKLALASRISAELQNRSLARVLLRKAFKPPAMGRGHEVQQRTA